MISKPNKIFKIFGSLASRGAYSMTGFGSLNPVSDWNEIATQCYEEGFESVDSNFHLKDLQLILSYMSHGIAYLYQQGIPEWNKYQSYPLGAVTQYKGKLYLNIGEVTGQSLPKSNCCGCECEEDSTVETPDVDKQHWEEIVTMKELDKLKETLNKLPSKFAEKQSDGTIKFTNPDGTTLITEYPIIRIGSNGNWFINDVDTGRKAIGEKGERGERGEKGDRGDKGERGQDGTNGRDGIDGKDGINGTNGVDGINGKSAYELAVDNGFTGTEPEWLASLKGQKGEKGATGAQGLKGDKGDKGDKGEPSSINAGQGINVTTSGNVITVSVEPDGKTLGFNKEGQIRLLNKTNPIVQNNDGNAVLDFIENWKQTVAIKAYRQNNIKHPMDISVDPSQTWHNQQLPPLHLPISLVAQGNVKPARSLKDYEWEAGYSYSGFVEQHVFDGSYNNTEDIIGEGGYSVVQQILTIKAVSLNTGNSRDSIENSDNFEADVNKNKTFTFIRTLPYYPNFWNGKNSLTKAESYLLKSEQTYWQSVGSTSGNYTNVLIGVGLKKEGNIISFANFTQRNFKETDTILALGADGQWQRIKLPKMVKEEKPVWLWGQTEIISINGVEATIGSTISRTGEKTLRFKITNNFETPATDVLIQISIDIPSGASTTVKQGVYNISNGTQINEVSGAGIGVFSIPSLPVGETEFEVKIDINTPIGNRHRFGMGIKSYTKGRIPTQYEEGYEITSVNTGVTKEVVA